MSALGIYDTYRREGVGPVMQKFMVMNGLSGRPEHEDASPQDVLTPEAMETFARMERNREYFLAHGMMPLSLYRPDIDALRAGRPRVMVGLGEESPGQTVYRTGVALAGKRGTEPILFPGDHGGYGPRSGTFAETLHRAFSDG